MASAFQHALAVLGSLILLLCFDAISSQDAANNTVVLNADADNLPEDPWQPISQHLTNWRDSLRNLTVALADLPQRMVTYLHDVLNEYQKIVRPTPTTLNATG